MVSIGLKAPGAVSQCNHNKKKADFKQASIYLVVFFLTFQQFDRFVMETMCFRKEILERRIILYTETDLYLAPKTKKSKN